jgi:hypothetical protein
MFASTTGIRRKRCGTSDSHRRVRIRTLARCGQPAAAVPKAQPFCGRSKTAPQAYPSAEAEIRHRRTDRQ